MWFTAKAGLGGLTKALAVELAARDITVNLVAPGLIDQRRRVPTVAKERGQSRLALVEHHEHANLDAFARDEVTRACWVLERRVRREARAPIDARIKALEQ